MNYIFMLLGAACIAMGGLAYYQTMRLEASQARYTLVASQLVACGGRLQNIIEDVRSDNEIDTLTDDDLRNVPAHWLLAPPTNSN